MEDPQNPSDVPVIEIKKPLLKKRKWVKKHIKSGYRIREHYLSDREEGSAKVYDERLQAGLMIFPHEQEYKRQEHSKGYGICPYELVAGKIKWKPRIFNLKKGLKPLFLYDMIHVDEGDVKKLIGALAYIARLTPRRAERQVKGEEAKSQLSDIDQKIMKFRL
jgi:hypothetical protein